MSTVAHAVLNHPAERLDVAERQLPYEVFLADPDLTAEEFLTADDRPVLTVTAVWQLLDAPHAKLELGEAEADSILIGHTIPDGVPVLRARPLPPRKGEPDLRVCDGCGRSLEGKRPQAHFCDECVPTVQNTQTTGRRRARVKRTDVELDALIEQFCRAFNDLTVTARQDREPKRHVFRLDPGKVRDEVKGLSAWRVRAVLECALQGRTGSSVDAEDANGHVHAALTSLHEMEEAVWSREDVREAFDNLHVADRPQASARLRWPEDPRVLENANGHRDGKRAKLPDPRATETAWWVDRAAITDELNQGWGGASGVFTHSASARAPYRAKGSMR